jgi:hypothetical protein
VTWHEQAWVELNSPYTNGAYATHLVIAGIVNTDHDFDLFVHPDKLAVRCHCSVATLRRQLADMVRDGYLEIREQGGGRAKFTRYRFLMKLSQIEQVSDSIPSQNIALNVVKPESSLFREKEELKVDLFDSFYAVFPLHRAPDAARRAWDKALKRGATAEEIIAGAKRYRDDPERSRDPHYIAHPATWLNAGRWKDEVESQESTEQKYAPLRLDASEL